MIVFPVVRACVGVAATILDCLTREFHILDNAILSIIAVEQVKDV